jgi:8-oxo-dGTP diphosphatase
MRPEDSCHEVMRPEDETPDRDRFAVVVHVMLQRGAGARAELFLLRRAGTGFMDGYYVLPGGHQRAGESLVDAARRECLEETGALPEALAPVCVIAYRAGRDQGLNFVFEAEGITGEPGLAERDRCDAADWFPTARLPSPAVPWLHEVFDLRRRGEWFRELHRA